MSSIERNNQVAVNDVPDNNEPVFEAPWEARAFAIVNQLAADKHYDWREWTNCLAEEISTAEKDSSIARTYYENWVLACEKLLALKGLVSSHEIDHRIDELLSEQKSEHSH